MKINKLLALVALTGLIALAPNASATVINWNQSGSTLTPGSGFFGGSTDFDDVTMTFTGVTVGDFTGVTGPALFHDHNPFGSTQFKLDLHLDGAWVNVATIDPVDGNLYSMADFGGLAIGSALLDGIRVQNDGAVGYGFHSFFDDTAFTFSAPSVPDSGSTVVCFSLALGAIALFRRKQIRSV